MITKIRSKDTLEKLLLLSFNVLVFVLAVLLLYVLGLSSHDVEEYEIMWSFTNDTNFLDAYSKNRFEFGSYFLFWNLAQFFSAAMTFYVFGLIALTAKFYVLQKYYNFPLIVFCIYIVTFVHILDGNQIRAALAATIIMYSLCIQPRNSFSYLFLALIAALLHYSGIVILAFYFTRAPLLGIISLLVFGFIFNGLISSSDYFAFARIWLADPDGVVNLTSSAFLMQVLVAIFCVFFWNNLNYQEKKGAFLNVFGVVTYIIFMDNAIVAHRIRELSMLGILAVIFLGDNRLTYVRFVASLGLVYIFLYNAVYVTGRLFS